MDGEAAVFIASGPRRQAEDSRGACKAGRQGRKAAASQPRANAGIRTNLSAGRPVGGTPFIRQRLITSLERGRYPMKHSPERNVTFLVQVQKRQNATWQGQITWMEEKKTVPFRSELELLRLIDSATTGLEPVDEENTDWK